MSKEWLDQPVWNSLATRHREFALGQGSAVRYAPDVIPFAAVEQNTSQALQELHALLAPGEAIYVGPLPDAPAVVPGLGCDPRVVTCLQMTAPMGEAPDVSNSVTISRLSPQDIPAMLGLIAIAFPGFFFRRTYELGVYYGVWSGDRLVAMAGQRMAFDRFCEISAVCTHPEHTGKGYAAALMTRLMHDHQAEGRQSFLHVLSTNERAIALYRRLGFETRAIVDYYRVTREP